MCDQPLTIIHGYLFRSAETLYSTAGPNRWRNDFTAFAETLCSFHCLYLRYICHRLKRERF